MKFALTGLSPLIMQSATLADPLHEMTKLLKSESGKKTKAVLPPLR